MPVHARYYTDPACSASWAAEPRRRSLLVEFGNDLPFTYVMGGWREIMRRDRGALIGRWLDDAAIVAHADGPAAVVREPDSVDLPRLHGGQGGRRAGPRGGGPLPPRGPRGAHVPQAQARHGGPARRAWLAAPASTCPASAWTWSRTRSWRRSARTWRRRARTGAELPSIRFDGDAGTSSVSRRGAVRGVARRGASRPERSPPASRARTRSPRCAASGGWPPWRSRRRATSRTRRPRRSCGGWRGRGVCGPVRVLTGAALGAGLAVRRRREPGVLRPHEPLRRQLHHAGVGRDLPDHRGARVVARRAAETAASASSAGHHAAEAAAHVEDLVQLGGLDRRRARRSARNTAGGSGSASSR